MNTVNHQVYAAMLNDMASYIHQKNVEAGWWTDTKLPEGLQQLSDPNNPVFKYVVGTKVALVQSEMSEALEGFRKSRMDDHLPNRQNAEVELADTFIRGFDLAGAMGFDLGGAIIDKMAYNAKRPDHKIENREAPGGKSI